MICLPQPASAEHASSDEPDRRKRTPDAKSLHHAAQHDELEQLPPLGWGTVVLPVAPRKRNGHSAAVRLVQKTRRGDNTDPAKQAKDDRMQAPNGARVTPRAPNQKRRDRQAEHHLQPERPLRSKVHWVRAWMGDPRRR